MACILPYANTTAVTKTNGGILFCSVDRLLGPRLPLALELTSTMDGMGPTFLLLLFITKLAWHFK